jgi:hypothetical protein
MQEKELNETASASQNSAHSAFRVVTVQTGTVIHKTRATNGVDIVQENVSYVATINLEELEEMARQAARNKSGSSINGALTVKVTKGGAQ